MKLRVKLIIFLTLVLIIIVFATMEKLNNNNIEHMKKSCRIQYPICDNYCQRAKLDLCIHKLRNNN